MKSLRYYILLLAFLSYNQVQGQKLKSDRALPDLNAIGLKCDSLRRSGQFHKVASLYFKTGQSLRSSELYVYAAWQYGLAKIQDSALISINHAIDNGMTNPKVLSLYNLDDLAVGTEMRRIVNRRLDSIKNKINKIDHFEIVTLPLDSFWQYFDAALSDKNNAERYFNSYISKGSAAIKDYYHMRYENVGNMIKQIIIQTPHHYAYTKQSFAAEKLNMLKRKMNHMMTNFSKFYPLAVYPKVFVVPGILSGDGTQTEVGLFIAAEMFVKGDYMKKDGLTQWQLNNIQRPDDMVYVTVHELMHFQQSYGDQINKETLLAKVIQEGVCDFLVELTSDNQTLGSNRLKNIEYMTNSKNLKFVLSEFKRDMYSKNLTNWMYNGGAIADRPADLGYTLGYMICKSFYERSENKEVALFELLNTNDFKKILRASDYMYLL